MEGVALDLAVEAVKLVVERFRNHLDEQKLLISNLKDQTDQLDKHIEFLRDYQKNYSTKPNSHSIITKALLRDVRNSIYEAEDAFDLVAIEAAGTRCWKYLWGAGLPNSKLAQFAELVKSVCEKVKTVRDEVQSHINNTTPNSKDGDLQEYEGAPRKQKYGPIFKDEEKTLRSRLGEVGEQLEVIVITGMHGIGKTSLAAKMFHDSEIQKNFSKAIWVTVSQRTTEDIYRSIMSQLQKSPHQVASNEDLFQQVADCLQQDQLFIVMDDVQEIENWKRLKSAFECGNRRSKVLLTTNNNEVPRYIGQYNPIELKQLNPKDSWSLLEWRVSMNSGCPKESKNDGFLIADQCEGLPLVIEFVGDTFARIDSRSFDISERQKIWQDVAIDMNTYFTSDDKTRPQKTSILSSYNHLPYELRACFLYLGIFPRRSIFSVSKLTRMWIAEGFIRPDGGLSLEETAEKHLKYLTDRNLVIIEDKMPDGSIKTCRMNYLFRDFCKTEAGYERENFFQEFSKSSTDGSFNPQINKVDKTRRFCIHGHISMFIPEFISSRPHRHPVWLHSFVSHSDKEVFTLQGKDLSIIRAAFKLLRVLDTKPIAFKKIPSELCQLIYLRFVTISLKQDVLPATISKLRNVQTLIVHTASRTLRIKADILKMAELRHLKTNASAALPKKTGACQKAERLQTLCGVSPKSCTEQFFSKTPNLKKLGIRGQLALLLHGQNDQLLVELAKLEKLKLLNDVSSSNPEVNLSSLLQPSRFPPGLKSLTLSATSLDWIHISVLGSLPKLEELKLKDKAFIGEKWQVGSESFPSLQTLHIERLDFVHWGCSRDHFPNLRRLELLACKKLREVPIGLADISTFQFLDLHHGEASAAASAMSISEVKRRMKQTDNDIVFKLSILPELNADLPESSFTVK